MRKVYKLALATAAMVIATTPASASLVYNSNISVSAQGFGNVPRDLTVDVNGQNHVESGCVGVAAGGAITFGSCIADGSVHDGNGVTNVGGDEPNPQADNQKYGIPTLAALGWTSAANIGLLFNAIEPSGNAITINDITLKFYNSTTGALLFAIDNGSNVTFDPSQQGNGSAGFVFTVDGAESTYLNTNLFNVLAGFGGASNVRIALESTIGGPLPGDAEAGPESWTAFNVLSPTPFGVVPEPGTWAMMLVGFAGIAMSLRRSRRHNSALLQIA